MFLNADGTCFYGAGVRKPGPSSTMGMRISSSSDPGWALLRSLSSIVVLVPGTPLLNVCEREKPDGDVRLLALRDYDGLPVAFSQPYRTAPLILSHTESGRFLR